MTDDELNQPSTNSQRVGTGSRLNWTRLEGVVGVGTLLTTFIWFLGMPTAMAFGVGFGSILVSDFLRHLIFRDSHDRYSELDTREPVRH